MTLPISGYFTKIWWCKVTNYTLPRVFNIHKTDKNQKTCPLILLIKNNFFSTIEIMPVWKWLL